CVSGVQTCALPIWIAAFETLLQGPELAAGLAPQLPLDSRADDPAEQAIQEIALGLIHVYEVLRTRPALRDRRHTPGRIHVVRGKQLATDHDWIRQRFTVPSNDPQLRDADHRLAAAEAFLGPVQQRLNSRGRMGLDRRDHPRP